MPQSWNTRIKKYTPRKANGGSWYTAPAGIQKIGNELFPSWYNKNQGKTNSKQAFDRVSKKKATTCTPDAAKIEIDVQKFSDPITKKEVIIAPDGYNATADDDIHKCDDAKPTVGTITATKVSGSTYNIKVSVVAGTHSLQQVEIRVGSTIVATLPVTTSSTPEASYTFTTNSTQTISATVTDVALYTTTGSEQFTPN